MTFPFSTSKFASTAKSRTSMYFRRALSRGRNQTLGSVRPFGRSVKFFTACLLLLMFVSTGCTGRTATANRPVDESAAVHADHDQATTTLDTATLPPVTAVTLAAGEKLQVVATTNLVADLVAQVGGEHITLYTLMGPAVDPHSYTSTPEDMRTLEDAQVVFINGLHLEEALAERLAALTAPVVAVNVGVTLRELEPDEHSETAAAADHHHEGADPHTWQRVANVKQWLENVRTTLRQLDPPHAAAYDAAADAYLVQLDALDAEIRAKVATIPAANRKLVTDHETFGYFADEYGFTIVGALIPSLSTSAEPSAQALAALQDQVTKAGVKAIFVGTTVNPHLADQLAQDLGIQVVSLYSDSLSAPAGPAATYLAFMRFNVNAIVAALNVQ